MVNIDSSFKYLCIGPLTSKFKNTDFLLVDKVGSNLDWFFPLSDQNLLSTSKCERCEVRFTS